MEAAQPRFEADRSVRDELASRFFEALEEGDVDGLRELLAADVELISDAGGRAPALPRGVVGSERVTRVLALVPQFARIGLVIEPREINGQSGAIVRDRDGRVLAVLVLDILDGRIQNVRSVINPDKLTHLGPVADAWAIRREYLAARRSFGSE